MLKLILIPIAAIFLFLIDLYVFQGVKTAFQNSSESWRKAVYYIYWGITAITILGFFSYHFINPDRFSKIARTFIMVGIFIHYFSKLFAMFFLIIDDIIRAGQWSYQKISGLFSKTPSTPIGTEIPRSEFLAKVGLVTATIPFVGMAYGIISGAHDYRVRKKTITLANLPKSFDGLKIVQISDIHSGSFFNKIAVMGGIDMLMAEKPDVIFFTGDLVNNKSSEIRDYIDIFRKVKAPLGVYSTLGNHDYGDYVTWPSKEAKMQNLKDLMQAHKILGWDLLMNENRTLHKNGDKISIVGIENWSSIARFPKYGKMDQAMKGTEESQVKLLLSHDPSHWRSEVLTKYPDIDLAFAGHTHGFQFGIEIPGFKWSPSQYVYKEWAGLYQEDNQYLYVNRGYGYLGYPGRIGMPPEITVIELKKMA